MSRLLLTLGRPLTKAASLLCAWGANQRRKHRPAMLGRCSKLAATLVRIVTWAKPNLVATSSRELTSAEARQEAMARGLSSQQQKTFCGNPFAEAVYCQEAGRLR